MGVNPCRVRLFPDVLASTVGHGPMCRLTWDGHDFLSDIEQPGVMERIKAVHGNRWLSWSLDVVKAVTAELAKQAALKSLF